VSFGSIYLPIGSNLINPVVGKPLYGVYSFAWGGLDPATGDPIGFYGKVSSKDYNSIYSKTKLDSMVYNGPVQPPYYGAFRNTFSWRNLSVSFNISYKFGYYMRRPSVNYTDLFSSWTGHSDYSNRWQKPGDEKITNVPSLIYPNNNPNRDLFYQYSEILVEKGDHIRMEDLSLSYMFDRRNFHQLPFQNIRFYIYASNLGTLWTTNDEGIDPYYINVPKDGKMLSFGMNVNF
jgi:hypothetical protein